MGFDSAFKGLTTVVVEKKKTISITYSESVFIALIVQNAMRMRRVVLSSVAHPAVQHSSALLHKRHDYRKRKILNTKWGV